MHESSLARELLALALKSALPGERVRALRGRLAETESLDPQAIAWNFAALARGTAAEGAVLDLRTEHLRATCAACGAVYQPEHHVLLCPGCGGTNAEVEGQPGLFIEEIDLWSPGS
jgi:hydrogenase nickel incorporation protein HypA/HybF